VNELTRKARLLRLGLTLKTYEARRRVMAAARVLAHGEQQAPDVRMERVRQAIALAPVDKIPTVIEASGWSARVTGMTLGDYCRDPMNATRAGIEAFEAVGNADALNYATYDPVVLSLAWMTRIKVPGRELAEDEPWQVEEAGLMTVEDYDAILKVGWPAFSVTFLNERVDGAYDRALGYLERIPELVEAARTAGVPFLNNGGVTTPFELLCGGRSLTQFVFDLYRMPDKVQAVMDAMMPGLNDAAILMNTSLGVPGMWVGGWRSASKMLAQPLWDRFVFPYLLQTVDQVAASGLIPILHLDSDWTRDLARFREFPAKTCILSLDGMTDIHRAKEVLGDHLCIMGDVPPALLSSGTPDEVYEYSSRLATEIGPTGFIMHSGCDIPLDAPLENVKAMANAAADAAV